MPGEQAPENPVTTGVVMIKCHLHSFQTEMFHLGDGLYTCPKCLDNYIQIKKVTLKELVDAYKREKGF